jgi:hypothetical protein
MIIRHPEEQELLEQFKSKRLSQVPVMVSTGYPIDPFAKDEAENLQRDAFIKPDLAPLLSERFGPRSGVVKGTYQDADFFAFQSEGEIVLAIVEMGRRTDWHYVVQKHCKITFPFAYASMEHPQLIHFLPGFFSELYNTLFNGELMDTGFSDEANHYRQAWRSEKQREDLDQSTAVVQSTLLRRSL